MAKFLGETGLTALWGKIGSTFINKTSGTSSSPDVVAGVKQFTNGLVLNAGSSWTSSDRAIPFSASGAPQLIQYSDTTLTFNPNTKVLKVDGNEVLHAGNLSSASFADSIPTQGSSRLITSGGMYSVLEELEDTVAASENSLNTRVTVLENTSLTSSNLTNHAKLADTSTAGQALVSKSGGYEWKTLGSNAYNSTAFLTEHQDWGLVAAAQNGTSNASTATTNTTTYINLIKGSTFDSGIKITGSQNVSVSAVSGTLTITGPNLSSYLTSHQSLGLITATSGTGTSENTSDQTSPYVVLLGGGAAKDSVQFVGSQNVSVTGKNGIVTITGPNLSSYVTGTGLTADKILLGNGNSTAKTSSKGITTTAPSSSSDDDTVPTSKAVWTAFGSVASALKYKGTVASNSALPATHAVGDVYVVSTAGTFAGKACEVGDYIVCNTAGTSANNAHWDVLNGENQVSNKSASLAAAGSSATIATVDGTDITVTTPSTWTGVAKTGTVTSVAMTVPTGFSVSGTPITGSGTLAVSFASGYSLPTTAKQTNWDTAYGWGNHSGLYLPLTGGTVSGAITMGSSSSANDTTKGINFTGSSSTTGHIGISTLLGIYSSGNIVLRPNGGSSSGAGLELTDTTIKFNGNSLLTAHQTIKQNGITGATRNCFGTCSTAAGTAAKTVDVGAGTVSLEAGLKVSVKFTNANTAGTPTLNVNSKGAKNIFHRGAQITTGANKALLAGTVDFVYDGTQWQLIGNYVDTDTHNSHALTVTNGTATSTTGTITYVESVTGCSASSGDLTATTTRKSISVLSSHQTIKQDGITGATVNRFGTCSTAAGTATKTVSVTGGTPTLEAGLKVTVKFSNKNTASTPTLNVNSLGAKNIFHNGSQITTAADKYGLLAGTVDFVYDGTQWQLVGNYYNSNTDTKVTQTVTTSSNTSARPLLLGNAYSDASPFSISDKTETCYASHLAKFAPSTGILSVVGLNKMTTSGTVETGSNTTVWNTNGGTTSLSSYLTSHKDWNLVAGAASGTANAATTNGNTKINLVGGSSYDSGVGLTGSNGVDISSDASGNISIKGMEVIKGTQTASTNAWTGVSRLASSTALVDGYSFIYWLPWTGTSTAATLTLTFADNSTKTINVYVKGTTRMTTHYGAGSSMILTYYTAANISGTSYEGVWAQPYYYSDANYAVMEYYSRPALYSTSAPLYRYKLFGLYDGKIVPLTITNQTSATQVAKTPNTQSIDITRGLFFYNSTTAVTTNTVVGAQTVYSSTAVSTGSYTFNTDVPVYSDIYLKGTVLAGGDLFKLDTTSNTSWYVYIYRGSGTAASTNGSFVEGSYYMYVGSSYSTANYFTLSYNNPVYQYYGGGLNPLSESRYLTVTKSGETSWSSYAPMDLKSSIPIVIGPGYGGVAFDEDLIGIGHQLNGGIVSPVSSWYVKADGGTFYSQKYVGFGGIDSNYNPVIGNTFVGDTNSYTTVSGADILLESDMIYGFPAGDAPSPANAAAGDHTWWIDSVYGQAYFDGGVLIRPFWNTATMVDVTDIVDDLALYKLPRIFAKCETAAGTVAKTITVTTESALSSSDINDGLTMIVYHKYANSATRPTFTIGGTTIQAVCTSFMTVQNWSSVWAAGDTILWRLDSLQQSVPAGQLPVAPERYWRKIKILSSSATCPWGLLTGALTPEPTAITNSEIDTILAS